MNFGRNDRASALLLGLSLALLGPASVISAFADTEPANNAGSSSGDSSASASGSASAPGSGNTSVPGSGNTSAPGPSHTSTNSEGSSSAAAGSGNGGSPDATAAGGATAESGSSSNKNSASAAGSEADFSSGTHAAGHRQVNERKEGTAANEHTAGSSERKEEHAGRVEHTPGTAEHSATASPAGSSTGAIPSHPSQKPVKLYGRIEELCAVAGAKLPLKMKAMVPIRDASLDAKTSTLSGKATTLAAAAQQNYPIDYIGSWAGDLTVYTSSFDKTYYQRDPDEVRKESQIMRSGAKGQYSVTFYQGNDRRITMQPSQVIFTTTESMGSQMQLLSKSQPGLGAMFGANNPMANMQVPVMVALHMGTPISSGEIGVTGNQLSSQLMKNTLKQLSPGVLENQVVTRDRDRNPETGKVQEGYSESVLRFTKLNRGQLYLQAAYVYYRNDGQFQAKYVLYGTLNRSSGASTAYPSPAANPMNIFGGGSGNPFGGAGGANPFGSGAGNLQQQMQQMQKMLQQMNGH